MRLLVGALVCFGTLQLMAGHVLAAPSSEQSDAPQSAVLTAEHREKQNNNWLALDASDRSLDGNVADPSEFDQHERGPVLLPLPAEAWTSLTVLASLAAFRGLKRARII